MLPPCWHKISLRTAALFVLLGWSMVAVAVLSGATAADQDGSDSFVTVAVRGAGEPTDIFDLSCHDIGPGPLNCCPTAHCLAGLLAPALRDGTTRGGGIDAPKYFLSRFPSLLDKPPKA